MAIVINIENSQSYLISPGSCYTQGHSGFGVTEKNTN